MRLVILESPFAGDLERNAEYLKLCIADCVKRGESCYPSHKIYPGSLDDNDPEQRKLGIEAGYAWWDAADCVVFYIDYGFSFGMKKALDRTIESRKPFETRNILR